MTEIHTIHQGKTISYEGYTDFKKCWRLLRELLEKRGYQYLEKEHNEVIKKDGKNIFFDIDAEKPFSDYVKGRVELQAHVNGLKEVTIQADDETIHCDECSLNITVKCSLITDYEGRYHNEAWMFFLRAMAEKFIYGRELKKYRTLVERDMNDVLSEAKKYLNLLGA